MRTAPADNTAPHLLNFGVMFTLSRFVLLPVAISGLALHTPELTAAAVGAAVLTDLADGGLARMFGRYTKFGKDLDSTVDFIFLHCLFIALYVAGALPVHSFAVIYAAMLGTLTLQLFSGASDEHGIVRTALGKPVGAVEYAYLLVLTAELVLPTTSALRTAAVVLVAALTPLAAAHIVECVIRLRRQPAGR